MRSLPRNLARPAWMRATWRSLARVSLVVLVAYLLGWVYSVLLTIFAGVLLGVFLSGIAGALTRRMRWPYGSVVASLIVLLLAVVALCGWLVGPALAAQIGQLVGQIPADLASLRRAASHVAALRSATPHAPTIGPLVGAAENVVSASAEILGGLAVAIVIGFYAAADPGIYRRALLRLVPPPRRARAGQVLERATAALMRWTIGRVIVMASVGVITSLGLWAFRVPVPFALGLIAGVATFVPYLGVLLSITPALLVAATKGPLSMLWVVVVFAAAHGTEAYVLSPLIAKRTIRFAPAFTIGVQLLLGTLWGVLGFTFAMPIAVIATVLVEMLYIEDTLGDRGAEAQGAPGATANL